MSDKTTKPKILINDHDTKLLKDLGMTTKPDKSFEAKAREQAEKNVMFFYSSGRTYMAKPETTSFMAGAEFGRAIGLEEGRAEPTEHEFCKAVMENSHMRKRIAELEAERDELQAMRGCYDCPTFNSAMKENAELEAELGNRTYELSSANGTIRELEAERDELRARLAQRHIIGKVYDVTRESINQLAGELDAVKAQLARREEGLRKIADYPTTDKYFETSGALNMQAFARAALADQPAKKTV